MNEVQEAILLGAKEIHNLREQNKELQKRLDFMIEQNDKKEDRINKAIYDLEKVKELNNKHILVRDNIVVHLDIDHIEYLLNILKGDNK